MSNALRFSKFDQDNCSEEVALYAEWCEGNYGVKLVPTHYAWTENGQLALVFRARRTFGQIILIGRPGSALGPAEFVGEWTDEQLEEGLETYLTF